MQSYQPYCEIDMLNNISENMYESIKEGERVRFFMLKSACHDKN